VQQFHDIVPTAT